MNNGGKKKLRNQAKLQRLRTKRMEKLVNDMPVLSSRVQKAERIAAQEASGSGVVYTLVCTLTYNALSRTWSHKDLYERESSTNLIG